MSGKRSRLWSGIMRPWGKTLRASVFDSLGRHSAALAKLAEISLHEESIPRLLSASAEALLRLSRADRAGVWVETSRNVTSWTGTVAQKSGEPAPAAWLSLDPSAIFHEKSPANVRSLVFAEHEFPPEPPGFFKGCRSGICLRLEIEGHLFGVAMLGSKRSRISARREILERAVSIIALALSLGASRQQCVVSQHALQTRGEIDRAIAEKSSPEEILRLIGTFVVRDTGAEFAGFASLQGAGVQWTVLSGSESQAAGAYTALRDVASSVLGDGQPAIRAFPAEGIPSVWLAGLALEPGALNSPLLLAGYRSEDEVPLDTLRRFAAAAVSATEAARSRSASALHPGDREQFVAEMRGLLETVQCGVLLL
ncbi:MAG TPA: hypothetical protein VGR58_00250, partial [Candidatus Acidoferrum sp.]|nr:hypothetical protein [Candidatus Acidoferrum sp.]